MNAYELADELENITTYKEAEHDIFSDKEKLTKAATMLRQQQAEIEALKDFAIWMTGCGYDFCQHDYFIKCRNELLAGKAPYE